jgi:hypothetical protein
LRRFKHQVKARLHFVRIVSIFDLFENDDHKGAGGLETLGMKSLLNNTFSNNHSSGAPVAYLVYMLFDEDMQLIPAKSGALKVQQANVLGTLEQTEIISEGDGYLYVYLTNRSGIKTNFDNLEIRYVVGQIRGTWDYYPYGLPWNNHSTTDIVRDDLYQSKEFQQREFSDATGFPLLTTT